MSASKSFIGPPQRQRENPQKEETSLIPAGNSQNRQPIFQVKTMPCSFVSQAGRNMHELDQLKEEAPQSSILQQVCCKRKLRFVGCAAGCPDRRLQHKLNSIFVFTHSVKCTGKRTLHTAGWLLVAPQRGHNLDHTLDHER